MGRFVKQFLFASFYILLVAAIVYGIFNIYHVDPTCYDKVQNQGEEGIDCGVVCNVLCDAQPLPFQIKSTHLLRSGEGYDFVAEVFNPNSLYGAREVVFEVIYKDANEREIVRRPGIFYILPGQTRFIIQHMSKLSGEVSQAIFEPQQALWQKALAEETTVNFEVRRDQYQELNRADVFSEFESLIFNDSNYDFGKVDVAILLLGTSGKIVGATTTELRTLTVGEERYLKVRWPFPIEGEVDRVRVEVTTNLFENLNFIQNRGAQQEKFQQFYPDR